VCTRRQPRKIAIRHCKPKTGLRLLGLLQADCFRQTFDWFARCIIRRRSGWQSVCGLLLLLPWAAGRQLQHGVERPACTNCTACFLACWGDVRQMKPRVPKTVCPRGAPPYSLSCLHAVLCPLLSASCHLQELGYSGKSITDCTLLHNLL
jgi:hypothetical protein